jgi:hypothetical protein
MDASFADSSSYNRTPTVSGASINTTEKKFGAGSGSFGGTVTYPDAASLDMGTQAWCIEGWFYLYDFSVDRAFLSHSNNYAFNYLTHEFICYFTTDGKAGITVGVPGPAEAVSTMGAGATCPLNEWFHLAICRGGTSSIQMYLNGVRDTTAALGLTNDATAITSSGSPLTVGGPGTSGLYTAFYGLIDDLRITIGNRRYSGDSFTPPTSANPDT